jgi:PIN domain nuclease of toxin-antitoxin system
VTGRAVTGLADNVLLDTHVLLWTAGEPKRLSRRAQQTVTRASARGGLSVASITLWEIAQLIERGRLTVQGTTSDFLAELLAEMGVSIIELSPTITELSMAFGAEFPRDPADRIIAATARAHALPLVTADERIRRTPLLKTIW